MTGWHPPHLASLRSPDFHGVKGPKMGTKKKLAAAIVAITLSTLTACGITQPAVGQLGEDQKLLAACPDKKLASMVSVDVSGTGRDEEVAAGHLKAISFVVRQTAICGGHLRITAFAGTSAVNRELYDGELQLAGATDIARLRKAPGVVDDVMNQVTKSYQEALTLPPPGDGSDIIGQYRLAQEYGTQLGTQYALRFVLLTDGFQTVGAGALDHPLDAQEATQLAERVDLPKLPGASVVVAGLGKVAGTPPPSDVVEGLVRVYDAICARTGAAECRSVTDFTVGG
jgi:hypothetical protein